MEGYAASTTTQISALIFVLSSPFPFLLPLATFNVSLIMSSTPITSSKAILEAALAKYSKKTGKDLRNHQLTSEIEACNSAESMLTIFRIQASAFDDFRNGDPRLIKCLRPFVSNLYAITSCPALSAVASGVSLVSHADLHCFLVIIYNPVAMYVFPPASPIFSAISVLLSVRIFPRSPY